MLRKIISPTSQHTGRPRSWGSRRLEGRTSHTPRPTTSTTSNTNIYANDHISYIDGIGYILICFAEGRGKVKAVILGMGLFIAGWH